MFMPSTFIVVGPSGGNQCCMCASIGTSSSFSGCPSGECKAVMDLSKSDAGVLSTCAAYTCCPCPTTGNGLTADISFVGASGSVTASISLQDGEDGYQACVSGRYNNQFVNLGGAGGMGAGCYISEDLFAAANGYVPIDIREHRYEKWVGSGTLCSAGDPAGDDPYGDPFACSGMDIIVSLCCCGAGGGPTNAASGVKECNVCNFALDIVFVPYDHNWSASRDANNWACSPNCWSHVEGAGPILDIGDYHKFRPSLVGGTCTNNVDLLTYSGTMGYWDCECLHNGQREVGGAYADPVTGTITIS